MVQRPHFRIQFCHERQQLLAVIAAGLGLGLGLGPVRELLIDVSLFPAFLSSFDSIPPSD